MNNKMPYLFEKLKLLPPDSLITTSEVDHADWNYRFFLKIIQRMRFKIIAHIIKEYHYSRVLEAGYGSGVFMPHLKDHCDELYGIDPHKKHKEVHEVLKDNGVDAKLYSGSITSLPFADDNIDCIVIVSALEYVNDIENACKEIKRTLKRGGKLIVVTPGSSVIVDIGLKLLTGESAKENYDKRRKRLDSVLLSNFSVGRVIKAPPLIYPIMRLYTAYELVNDK